MKKSLFLYFILLVLCILSIVSSFTSCKKTVNPIKYPKGTFPDSVMNMSDINSQYDDYNTALYQISNTTPIIFSSNRKSSGGQFDLEQASFSFVFDQTTGAFVFESHITSDPFLASLISKAVTAGNDFGPYRLYSSIDGFEYLILSSVNAQGNLDLYYFRNRPVNTSSLPDVTGPFPVSLLNSGSDDAYLSLDANQDTAYFTSSGDGSFDIYMHQRPAATDLSAWLSQGYSVSAKVDSINSTADDKCPWTYKNIMVFASNRPGGLGGYDLYYSVFRKGKWSSPLNLGPGINSSSDEYRPVIGNYDQFTNNFLIFSSNRPGGKGGFDLYFTGIEFPVK